MPHRILLHRRNQFKPFATPTGPGETIFLVNQLSFTNRKAGTMMPPPSISRLAYAVPQPIMGIAAKVLELSSLPQGINCHYEKLQILHERPWTVGYNAFKQAITEIAILNSSRARCAPPRNTHTIIICVPSLPTSFAPSVSYRLLRAI